jgi:hypothetical protein
VEVVVNLQGPMAHSWSSRSWLKWSSVTVCVAASVFSLCINWLVAGSSWRVDIGSDGRETLSPITRETLANLKDAISIYVLVSQTDSLAAFINPVVDRYSLATSRIKVHRVDPDRNPGRYLALQAELGVVSGASQDGKSLSDSIIVVEHGKTRAYVTVDDVQQLDPATGEIELRVEQALTRAVRRLVDSSHPVVCFTRGHHERTLDDVSPEGLSELKTKLVTDLADVRVLNLEESGASLRSCALLIVPEPELPLSESAIAQITGYSDRIGSLWIMSGTVPDDAGRVHGTGLDALLAKLGVSLGANVIIENDASRRLPDGFGESFFAQPIDHAITRALGTHNPNRSLRVVVSLAPSIEFAAGAPVTSLLRSSAQAVAVQDIGSYLKSEDDSRVHSSADHEFTLAIAAEFGGTDQAAKRVVVSPASVAINRALRSALVGNKAFVDGVLSWLLATKPGVEIASSSQAAPSLELSDSDLKRIDRYVLMIMPGAATLLSLAVFAARRRRQGTAK